MKFTREISRPDPSAPPSLRVPTLKPAAATPSLVSTMRNRALRGRGRISHPQFNKNESNTPPLESKFRHSAAFWLATSFNALSSRLAGGWHGANQHLSAQCGAIPSPGPPPRNGAETAKRQRAHTKKTAPLRRKTPASHRWSGPPPLTQGGCEKIVVEALNH